MAFDFESGMSGAAAGSSIGGPYGAAAGFVIGGFVGGGKKKRIKKQQRRFQQRYNMLTSPAYLKDVTRGQIPIARENIMASGAGNAIKQDIASNLTSHGLIGTGVGTALQSAASLAPANMATQMANALAQGIIERQITGLIETTPAGIRGNMGNDTNYPFGDLKYNDIATIGAVFRGLGNKSNQSSGTGAPTFSGAFPPGGDFNSGYRTGSLFPKQPDNVMKGDFDSGWNNRSRGMFPGLNPGR